MFAKNKEVRKINQLVSVLMTVYNEEISWIKDALDSILNQTYRFIEIIVVVDNPNDQKIIQLLQDYQNKCNSLKVIFNEENIGLARSLNKAFEISTGEFIARMDSDDISIPDRIERQVNFINQSNNIDLLCSSCIFINEAGEEIGIGETYYLNSKQIDRILKITNILIHPSWLMPRNTFKQLDGYRNFRCSQDYDFLLRMVSNKLKIVHMDEKLIKYRIRKNSISLSRAFEQYLIAEYIRLLFREREINLKADSFSEKNLKVYLTQNGLGRDEDIFNKSQIKVKKLSNENSIFKKIAGIIPLITYSSYCRKFLFNGIKYKITKSIK